MTYDEATKEAWLGVVFQQLERRVSVNQAMAALGLNHDLFYKWVHERPEWEELFARVREGRAHELVEECLSVAKDREKYPDPKERRVVIDTNLRIAALYYPQRYSQAALDRIVAPPEELERVNPAEIARELMRAVEVAGRLQLPAPADDIEDADFDDA